MSKVKGDVKGKVAGNSVDRVHGFGSNLLKGGYQLPSVHSHSPVHSNLRLPCDGLGDVARFLTVIEGLNQSVSQVANLLNPSLNSSETGPPSSTHESNHHNHISHNTSHRPVATGVYGSRTVVPIGDGITTVSGCLRENNTNIVKPVTTMEKSGTGPPSSPLTTAYRWWHDNEAVGSKLALPPQYVSPNDLYKALPKYTKLPRPDMHGATKATPSVNAPSEVPRVNTSPQMSPRLNLAIGSPVSSQASRLTPHSMSPIARPRSPKCTASPPSAARSCQHSPPQTDRLENTPPSTARSQHSALPLTPTSSRASSVPQSPHSQSSGGSTQSPRERPSSRSEATSPIRFDKQEADVASQILRPMTAKFRLQTSDVTKVDTAQGSPLSSCSQTLPPIGRPRRVVPPHVPEPTVDTYKRFCPNTYATNTVWNERREGRAKHRPGRTILITSKDGTRSVTRAT